MEESMADKVDFSQVANVLRKQRMKFLNDIPEDDTDNNNNNNNNDDDNRNRNENDNKDSEMKDNGNNSSKNNNNNRVGLISAREAQDFENYLSSLNDTDEAPEYLVCPLSLSVYEDPVVTPNGSIYERKMIVEWLEDNDCDPIDKNVQLSVNDLKPELQIKNACDIWRKMQTKRTLEAKLSKKKKEYSSTTE